MFNDDGYMEYLAQYGGAIAVGLQILLISVSVILTIHILLHKSDPKASIMWIALVWFAPVFGAAFYLLFGINRIQRRARRLITAQGKTSEPPETYPEIDWADDPWIEFRRLGNHVTRSNRHSGNSIKVFEGVEVVHKAMIDSLNAAQSTIALSTYIFRNDDLGQALAAALIRADQRGVDVKVLLDGVGSGFFRSRIYRRLRAGGVDVYRFLHSSWPWRMPYLNLRNHRKLLIIDGAIAFTGSLNIGRVRNLETHFKIRGPVIAHMQEAFAYDWTLAGGPALPQAFFKAPSRAVGKINSRGILSGPIYSRERLRWVILGALGTATKNIRIVTPYFIPDQGLLSGIILAALRGVKVEILLPEHSNYAFADWASNRQIKELLRVGCHIYQRPDVFDHSKVMTVDGHWALLGSSNWDARSLRLNFEFDLECEDLEFVQTLDKIIDIRLGYSSETKWDIFKDRSVFEKLRDSSARLLLPYL